MDKKLVQAFLQKVRKYLNAKHNRHILSCVDARGPESWRQTQVVELQNAASSVPMLAAGPDDLPKSPDPPKPCILNPKRAGA